MKEYIQQHIQISLHLIIIACTISFAAWVAHHNQTQAELAIASYTEIQEKNMLELASITDRNGADATVEKIILDCPRREEYESLLVKLGTLTKKDLLTVQNLYESCGTFYAERKALMVSKLEREFEIYDDFQKLQKSLGDNTSGSEHLEKWNELVNLEKMRSTLLTDQSAIQIHIITLLISGSTVYSKDVSSLVREANEIAELLAVNDHKIDELRSKLQN